MAIDPQRQMRSVQSSQDRKRLVNSADNPTLKPPLKWAGGKRWLVPYLRPVWDSFRDQKYIEPFCGGLATALGLKPRSALLNDVNPHLINFYRQLQTGLSIEIEMRNDESLFYKHRERFNTLVRSKSVSTPEAAQLFYYLNRTCFNGLCRFNQNGEYNVPFGTYKSIKYPASFNDYVSELRRWKFTTQDVAELKFGKDDFIYADPPYDVEFTTYSAGGFSWDDQVRTAELLARHPGPVVISNQATDRIIKLYRKLKFRISYFDAPRRISCTGDRTAVKEVLATRNL